MPVLARKTPLILVLTGLLIVTLLTSLAYGAFATANWQRMSMQRQVANRIRAIQRELPPEGGTVEPGLVRRSWWAVLEDPAYERALLECPSIGPLRFGAVRDPLSGERLPTWEVLLARAVVLGPSLLLCGVIGYGGRWLLARGHKPALNDQRFRGEAAASCARSAARAAAAAPVLALVLWHILYDRGTLGAFWPTRLQELVGLSLLGLGGAALAARSFGSDFRAYQRRIGPHCRACGYPRRGLPPQTGAAVCPECGSAVSSEPGDPAPRAGGRTRMRRRAALITLAVIAIAAILVVLRISAADVVSWVLMEPPLRT